MVNTWRPKQNFTNLQSCQFVFLEWKCLTHCGLVITGINPEAFKWGVDRYDRLLCPGLRPGPPSQTPGGLGQRYWCVSAVTWPPQMELRRWRSSGPSSVMWCHMATQIWVNTDSGNGLLPKGTKPLPEPMFRLQWFSSFHTYQMAAVVLALVPLDLPHSCRDPDL